jgi:hypothetical protein
MFTKMVIVAETLLASDAKVIERYITDDVRYAGLCKNEIRGGGGPDGQPPGYTQGQYISGHPDVDHLRS